MNQILMQAIRWTTYKIFLSISDPPCTKNTNTDAYKDTDTNENEFSFVSVSLFASVFVFLVQGGSDIDAQHVADCNTSLAWFVFVFASVF